MENKELFNLAKALTQNEEIAKDLAQQASMDDDPRWNLCCECVDWLYEQEEGLFQNPGEYDPTAPSMASLEDVVELSTLSTEERVVVLLRIFEEFDVEETKGILGIEEDAINACLQSAYRNNHPPVAQETSEEEPVVKRRRAFNRQHMFLLSSFALILCVVGWMIGAIQGYAGKQYEEGLSCMQAGEYREAIEKFSRASRYGDKHEDLAHWLAESHYAVGEYEKAIRYFEKAGEKSTHLFACYERLANKALERDDTDKAISILEKAYSLQADLRTSYRLAALHNNGKYEEESSGIVYNAYGDPLHLMIKDKGAAAVGDVSYGKKRVFSMINQIPFNYDPASQIEAIIKKDGIRLHETFYYESKYPSKEIMDNEEIHYANTIENGRLKERRVTMQDKIYDEFYFYDGDRLERITTDHADIPETVFAYDAFGNLIKKTYGNDVTEYRYNEEGQLQEIIEPSGDVIYYKYCADGTKWRYDKCSKDGQLKELAFYNPACGWVGISLE